MYRNFLVSLVFATAVCGCGSQVQQVPFQVSDVRPGFCKAVEARPGYFWERPQRVMPCRIEHSDRLSIRWSGVGRPSTGSFDAQHNCRARSVRV